MLNCAIDFEGVGLARRTSLFVAAIVTLACGSANESEVERHAGLSVQPPELRALESELVAQDAEVCSEDAAPKVPVLEWVACGEDYPGTECGVAAVPLDYDDPNGTTTAIALARIPATDLENRLGSVFINPGGPGGSGVGFVLDGFGEFLANLLGGRFDVVGFDPRGVGASEPLHCFDSEDELNTFLVEVPVFPYLPDQKRPYFEHFRSLHSVCTGQRERIISHMSTADVVRDLDLLRQAVGDPGLTYLGFSYGTYIGNTYANLFPDKVRALVIDGVLDPRLWASGYQVVSDRVATDEVMVEFFRLCDEAGDECDLATFGGSAARFEELAAALKVQPLIFEDGTSYSYDFLILDALYASYAPETWGGPEGYAALFAALADAVLGLPAPSEEVSGLRKALHGRLRSGVPQESDYDNGLDAYYGNQCADTQYPNSFREFRRIGAYAEHDSYYGPVWWWQNAGCASWPVAPDRYTGPWTAHTSSPVLIVGNYFDGATDYDGAVATSVLLPNSRLLSYAGWGHTAFGRSDCVADYVVDYLVNGVLPPPGTVCPANPNPFIPDGEATATRMQNATAPLVGLPAPALLR